MIDLHPHEQGHISAALVRGVDAFDAAWRGHAASPPAVAADITLLSALANLLTTCAELATAERTGRLPANDRVLARLRELRNHLRATAAADECTLRHQCSRGCGARRRVRDDGPDDEIGAALEDLIRRVAKAAAS